MAAKKSVFDVETSAIKTALEALETIADVNNRQLALNFIAARLKLKVSVSATPEGTRGTADLPVANDDSNGGTAPPLKQWFASKKPLNDVERLACLAFYLRHYANTPSFKTKDLTKANTDAAGPSISNMAQASQNAMRQSGYITSAGGKGGHRQITARGEALVEALPDRDAVKRALADHPKRKASKKRATKARG